MADATTGCTVYYWKNIITSGGKGTGKIKITSENDWYVFRLTNGKTLQNPTYEVTVKWGLWSKVTYKGSTRTLIRNPHKVTSFVGKASGKGAGGKDMTIPCASWTHTGDSPPGN